MRKSKTFNIFFIFFCIILNFIAGSVFDFAENSTINSVMQLNLATIPSVIAGICRFTSHPGLVELSSSILKTQTAGLISFVVAFFSLVDLVLSIRNSTERELYPKLTKVAVNLIIGALCLVPIKNYIIICVASVLILIASTPFLSRRHKCFNLIFGMMFLCTTGSEWNKLIFRIFKVNISLLYPFSLVFLLTSIVGVFFLCKIDQEKGTDNRFHGIGFPILLGLAYQIFGINMIWFMQAFFLTNCIIKNYTYWAINTRHSGICVTDIFANLAWQLCMFYLFITLKLGFTHLFIMIIVGQIIMDLVINLIFSNTRLQDKDILSKSWLGSPAC